MTLRQRQGSISEPSFHTRQVAELRGGAAAAPTPPPRGTLDMLRLPPGAVSWKPFAAYVAAIASTAFLLATTFTGGFRLG